MANHRYFTDVEMDRERLVRTLPCPVDDCGAPAGARCPAPEWAKVPFSPAGLHWDISHTGRYEAAVRAGLVPALAGAS